MLPWFILAALVLLALLSLGWMGWQLKRKRTLSSAVRLRLQRAWQVASVQTDRHRRLLDCEKVVEQALTEIGFKGSFFEKLKRAGPRFRDQQPVWEAHKLRNRIAHEVGIQVSERDIAHAVSAFGRALKDLGV